MNNFIRNASFLSVNLNYCKQNGALFFKQTNRQTDRQTDSHTHTKHFLES